MSFSLKSKVLAASALGLLMLTSCGQPALNKDADPAQVMKDARMHFVTAAGALVDKTASGTEKGTFTINLTSPEATAKISGGYDSMVSKAADLSFLVNANGDVTTTSFGKISGELSAELRLLAKVFYAKLTKISAKADQAALQAQIDEALQMAPMFTDKWMKFDLIELAKQSGGDAAALEQAFAKNTPEDAKKMIAKLNDNEIFTLKEKLAPQDNMYVYKVVPNKAGITALLKAVMADIDASAQMTPEDQASLEQVLDMLSGDNVTHTLYIDGEMNYRKFVSTGTINSPEIKADITSTITMDKNLNSNWVLDVKANNPAGNQSFNAGVEVESKDLNTKMKILFDAPYMNTKFDMNLQSSFKGGDVKIETPTGAMDLSQMMGSGAAMGAPAATGTTLPADLE